MTAAPDLRRALTLVIALNLGYCGIEAAVGFSIGSVSLLVDSADFLEDASLNLLILLALGWSLAARVRLGSGLAIVLALPAGAALWTLVAKFGGGIAPAAVHLTLTALGALAVNLVAALIITPHRHAGGAMLRAAFLSARNDVAGNVAILAAGGATAATGSIWPDIVVALGLVILHGGAAHEVWRAARQERLSLDQAEP